MLYCITNSLSWLLRSLHAQESAVLHCTPFHSSKDEYVAILLTAGMLAASLLLAFNYRLLQLPGPRLNELGKAEWPVTSTELSKAFRKLSILVHPDKNPTEEARQAFEQLKQAYNELKDEDKLVR